MPQQAVSAAAITPAAASRPAARAVGVTKIYRGGAGAVTALDDVSVELPGATLMHCLAGLDSVTSGQVWIGDVEISQLSDKRLTTLRRDRVGFVFQAFNLLPALSAADN